MSCQTLYVLIMKYRIRDLVVYVWYRWGNIPIMLMFCCVLEREWGKFAILVKTTIGLCTRFTILEGMHIVPSFFTPHDQSLGTRKIRLDKIVEYSHLFGCPRSMYEYRIGLCSSTKSSWPYSAPCLLYGALANGIKLATLSPLDTRMWAENTMLSCDCSQMWIQRIDVIEEKKKKSIKDNRETIYIWEIKRKGNYPDPPIQSVASILIEVWIVECFSSSHPFPP